MNTSIIKTLIINQFSSESTLNKQLRDVGQRNKRRTSQGSRLLVFIRATRRRLFELLAVVDPQSRLDRRRHLVLLGLLFVCRTMIDGIVGLRPTDNPARP